VAFNFDSARKPLKNPDSQKEKAWILLPSALIFLPQDLDFLPMALKILPLTWIKS
jgi:hypothetical protein